MLYVFGDTMMSFTLSCGCFFSAGRWTKIRKTSSYSVGKGWTKGGQRVWNGKKCLIFGQFKIQACYAEENGRPMADSSLDVISGMGSRLL